MIILNHIHCTLSFNGFIHGNKRKIKIIKVFFFLFFFCKFSQYISEYFYSVMFYFGVSLWAFFFFFIISFFNFFLLLSFFFRIFPFFFFYIFFFYSFSFFQKHHSLICGDLFLEVHLL